MKNLFQNLEAEIQKLKRFATENNIDLYDVPINKLFDTYEIWPVKDCSANQDQSVFETCEPSEADIWSVYGHLITGGLDCIADCPDRITAEDLQLKCEFILRTFYPDLEYNDLS